MQTVKYDCDCDRVIEMEEMGIGVEEILQFVRGVLTKDDLQTLIHGLMDMTRMEEGALPEELVR